LDFDEGGRWRIGGEGKKKLWRVECLRKKCSGGKWESTICAESQERKKSTPKRRERNVRSFLKS